MDDAAIKLITARTERMQALVRQHREVLAEIAAVGEAVQTALHAPPDAPDAPAQPVMLMCRVQVRGNSAPAIAMPADYVLARLQDKLITVEAKIAAAGWLPLLAPAGAGA